MNSSKSRNIKLGVFVVTATLMLIAALYLIGTKQNLFGSTFRLKAEFSNVNGLIRGNNVRYAGINIGTVVSVNILNDSTVIVEMVIENKMKAFIKKNSWVEIGTDGLMGDKLINIYPANEPDQPINNGDLLQSRKKTGTDEMMHSLNVTNENVKVISEEVKLMVTKLNNPNSLWTILMDTSLSENIRSTLVAIRITSERTAILSGNLNQIAHGIRKGQGTIGALITDTTLSHRIRQSIVNIEMLSDTVASVTGDLHYLIENVKQGKGAFGTLLMDTSFAANLNLTMKNLEDGTRNFNENMEGLKQSIFLRKYFRKKKKN